MKGKTGRLADRFVMMRHSVFDTPEYALLSSIERDILWLLIRRFDGFNNGNIPLGVREVERWCKCSRTTACQAFKNLQTANFISLTYRGHLVPEIGRPNATSRWRVNHLPTGT